MRVQGEPKHEAAIHRPPSAWREAADLLRFSLEAAAVSGAIVMTAWVFTGIG